METRGARWEEGRQIERGERRGKIKTALPLEWPSSFKQPLLPYPLDGGECGGRGVGGRVGC